MYIITSIKYILNLIIKTVIQKMNEMNEKQTSKNVLEI